MQNKSRIANHYILVVDLAGSGRDLTQREPPWDWAQGEPPEDKPEYYLRYNKTFSRMGGTLRTLSLDNKQFFLALLQELEK